MATDLDIEMDLDVGLAEEDFEIPQMETLPSLRSSFDQQKPILSDPNDTSDVNALDPSPQKVHLRGLDDFTTDDIRAFASEYFDLHKPSHVEWIDDTSANLVYEAPEIAQDALVAFAAVEVADFSLLPLLQSIPAKPSPLHPQTNLEVRRAVIGDRKQAGAHKRSRFYLLNPKHDPSERRKRNGHSGGSKYRDRDDGGYRSQRYDDREQQRRQERDGEASFDASLYDDDEDTLAKRAAGYVHQVSSRGDDARRRERRVRSPASARKELFPTGESGKERGRLRSRSASPLRDGGDHNMKEPARRRQADDAASTNRLQARLIKAKMREADFSKELFPSKTIISHRSPDAFDAANETADLFSSKMSVPFTDGSSDYRSTPLAARITSPNSSNEPGFSIRGIANARPLQDFNIKGAARVKELFPSTLGTNEGKELFSGRLEGRDRRRQKAEDLFY